jgi:hypothetical protein
MSYVVGATIKILESSGQTSTVSGRTERVDQSTTSGTGHIVEVCDVVKQAPGATAACTITWSATTSARALSVSLAFLAVMPTPTDTGLTVSEAGPDSNVIRAVTDTGLTASDSIAAQKIFGRVATDTGLTVSDSLASRRCPAISDTGLTVTDSLVDQEVFARTLTVTGLTVTDSPAATTLRARTISDTLTITDGGVVFPGAHFNVTAADYGLGPPPIVFGPLG